MSLVEHAAVPVTATRHWRASPIARWTSLVVLLLSEFAVFSIRFDTAPLVHMDSSWAKFVTSGHLIIQFGISVIAAMLVFRGDRVRQAMSDLATQVRDTPFPWLPLGAHVGATLVFYRLTALLIEGNVLTNGSAGTWVFTWACVGAASLGFWLTAAVPPILWRTVEIGAARWLVVASALAAAMAVATGQFADRLWEPLSRSTLFIVAQVLQLFYSSLIVNTDELVVGTARYSVQIAPQCCGYEGIGLVAVFLGIFLLVFRRDLRFPNSLLLLPIGCAVIWLVNALRIAMLVVVGNSISPAVASGGFHTQAGWLAFNAVTLGLIAFAWNSAFFAKAAASSPSAKTAVEYRGAPYLVPFLVLVGSAMLTKAFSSGGVDELYFIRAITTAAALFYFWHTYRERDILRWSWSLHAVVTGVAVFLVWILIERIGSATDTARVAQAVSLANMSTIMVVGWIILRIAGSVLVVPLAEELAFRGYLTRRLQATDFEQVRMASFSWFSFLASSVCFGALHGRWIAATIAGMAYALVVYRRGRLSDAVLAHATTNALIVVQVFYTGDWSLWS